MKDLLHSSVDVWCGLETAPPLRLNAESSSRPLTPSPLKEGGGGVAKYNLKDKKNYSFSCHGRDAHDNPR